LLDACVPLQPGVLPAVGDVLRYSLLELGVDYQPRVSEEGSTRFSACQCGAALGRC
jgi:hypothetical protein